MNRSVDKYVGAVKAAERREKRAERRKKRAEGIKQKTAAFGDKFHAWLEKLQASYEARIDRHWEKSLARARNRTSVLDAVQVSEYPEDAYRHFNRVYHENIHDQIDERWLKAPRSILGYILALCDVDELMLLAITCLITASVAISGKFRTSFSPIAIMAGMVLVLLIVFTICRKIKLALELKAAAEAKAMTEELENFYPGCRDKFLKIKCGPSEEIRVTADAFHGMADASRTS